MVRSFHLLLAASIIFSVALANPECPLERLSDAVNIEWLADTLSARTHELALLAKGLIEKHGKTVEVELSDGRARVGGIEAEVLDAPGSKRGRMNSGVFALSNPQPRVIKLFSTSPYKAVPFDDSPGSVNLDGEYKNFGRMLKGAVLLEQEGGPQILGLGRANVHDSKGTRSFFYLETERLFPGEPALGVKDRVFREKGEALKIFRQVGPDGRTVIQKMAALYLNATLHGIAPMDGDFMISQSGGVRWIDGDFWEKGDWHSLVPIQRRKFRIAYQQFERTMFFGGMAKDFESALRNELAHRQGISEADRALLEKVLFTTY